MPLISCEVELKIKWAKYCVLPASGAGNENADSKILFSLSKTQNHMFFL